MATNDNSGKNPAPKGKDKPHEKPHGEKPAPVPTAPVAGATAEAPAEKPAAKPKKELAPVYYKTADEIVHQVNTRTSGLRRGFKVTAPDGKVVYCMGANHKEAVGYAALECGFKHEELGVAARAPRAAAAAINSEDAVTAFVNSLPAEKREAFLASLLAKKAS